jgi:phytoene dehydrogenase-like protein
MDIGIVGGGIAGLYSALLLKQQGHKATIFEANNRIGGRIYSHHFTSVTKGEDPFFEAGAMRIPLSSLHSCVFDLVRYLNEHNNQEEPIEFLPYVIQHANNKIFMQGKIWDAGDRSLAAEMGLPFKFHGKTAHEILLDVMSPWITLLRQDFELGFAEVLRYDEISFRHYLRTEAMWPDEVIDFVELIMSQTNQYDQSFTDLVMQTMHFNTPGNVSVGRC